MKRSIAFAFLLAALALPAAISHAEILLDSTENLTKALANGSNATTWGLNSPAYNRINGGTFQVGATSYDATSMSFALLDNSSITRTVRLQFWELPSLTSTTPAAGAAPFHTQDYSVALSTTSQYYTFPLTSGTVTLQANTRYSFGILMDSGTSFTRWDNTAPAASFPASSIVTWKTGMFSTSGGSTFNTSGNIYSLQLTGDAAAPVPEPSTWALALAGVTCSAWGMARRRRAAGRVRSV